MSTPTPENNMHTTGEPHKTTKQLLISANVHNVTVTHQTHTHADGGVATTEEMEIATITNNSSDDRTSDLVVTKSAAATTGSFGGGLLHSSAAATTTEAKPPNRMEMSETVNPTGDEQSTTSANIVTPSATSAETSAETSAASLAATVPTTEPANTTKPEVTEKFSPTAPSDNSTPTPVSTQNQSTPSTSATTTKTESTTSGVAPVFLSTIKEKSTTRANPPSTSWPLSTTRIYTSTSEKGITRGSSTEPPSTVFSMNTTANSTSPVGILIPLGPKTFPTHTTKSATTGSKSQPSTDSQPCSSRGVVKHCLIAIASLAGLATIFMVTTITLCAKLSTKKYRMKRPQPATEMMCISSLLPERDYTYTRQRNPVSNGVLVMHVGGDSDEEGGDNLTLSSFLPENDHSV
ncbi:P-selectin glycoprotein ligand 1 [Tautogolabrus adspersus]